jgi:hypothetical protein
MEMFHSIAPGASISELSRASLVFVGEEVVYHAVRYNLMREGGAPALGPHSVPDDIISIETRTDYIHLKANAQLILPLPGHSHPPGLLPIRTMYSLVRTLACAYMCD